MSQGVLLFAFNNESINYVKQAVFCANRIKKYLNLPVSLVTDIDNCDCFGKYFDKVIKVEKGLTSRKAYRDGSLSKRVLAFNNYGRENSFDLSPYNETIVMDTDYIVANDKLLNCFEQNKSILLYKDATHLGIYNGTPEFQSISDSGIDFYWATVVYFKKNDISEIFFNLIKHIKENYMHYRGVYQFKNTVYRNDFAFSIAVHILSGYTKNNFVGTLPGKKFYAIDRDILLSIKDDVFQVLVEKQDRLGEYTFVKFKGSNLHVMNKFSLARVMDE